MKSPALRRDPKNRCTALQSASSLEYSARVESVDGLAICAVTALFYRSALFHLLRAKWRSPFPWEAGMNIISLIISLVSGAIGGNVAGAAMKDKSLGPVGNSISGILGGGIGGAILQLLGIGGGTAGTLDIAAILENIASGGVGGGILLAIVSVIKAAMAK
jgi:uncharacterized membrane protein YeaQ/YmgE (transglycosylase-associated protein family)